MSDIPVAGPKRRFKKKKKEANPEVQRQLPNNVEAEVGVLGSLMLTPHACDDVVAILRSEDFFDQAHATIFQHMMDMHGAGEKIDPLLVRERLMAAGEFETIGGAARLAEIFSSVTHAAHVLYYSNIVRNKATARNLISTCSELLNAFLPETEPNELLNAAEQKVFAIRESRQSSNLSSVNEVLEVAMDRLEAKARGEVQAGTVETHFSDLDDMTGGLHANELVILAARPSMGKTAFALNITENVATKSNQPVLFVSLEMAAIELIERVLCCRAGVNGHRLRKGTLTPDERKMLVNAAGELSTAPLFVDDSPTRNVSEIAGAARRIIRREGGLALIVIDYLQLLQPDSSSDPRQEQVAKMARRLKGLARELKCPILCLSQLNRQTESSGDHRPKLSHLRESGAIEQDADVVMFVHRESYYKKGTPEEVETENEAEIIIEKQRNGPTGKVDLVWEKDFTRFSNRAPARYSAFDNNTPPAI